MYAMTGSMNGMCMCGVHMCMVSHASHSGKFSFPGRP